MGQPAVVRGDRIIGVCSIHLVPGPTGPIKAPPMPFSAPLSDGLVDSVLIGGQPAAVLGSTGTNSPIHPGLDPSDPYAVSLPERGAIQSGSSTVLIGGKPAAIASSACTMCAEPGQLIVSTTSVLIGG